MLLLEKEITFYSFYAALDAFQLIKDFYLSIEMSTICYGLLLYLTLYERLRILTTSETLSKKQIR